MFVVLSRDHLRNVKVVLVTSFIGVARDSLKILAKERLKYLNCSGVLEIKQESDDIINIVQHKENKVWLFPFFLTKDSTIEEVIFSFYIENVPTISQLKENEVLIEVLNRETGYLEEKNNLLNELKRKLSF